MRTDAERLYRILPTVLSELREREDALCVPLLGDDVRTILPIVLTPLWFTDGDGAEVLALLAAEGHIEPYILALPPTPEIRGQKHQHDRPGLSYAPKEALHGRASGALREFALDGDTTGEVDEYGLPVRYPWTDEYAGKALVVYGHTPVPEAVFQNNTICVDTGCVFGGSLSVDNPGWRSRGARPSPRKARPLFTTPRYPWLRPLAAPSGARETGCPARVRPSPEREVQTALVRAEGVPGRRSVRWYSSYRPQSRGRPRKVREESALNS